MTATALRSVPTPTVDPVWLGAWAEAVRLTLRANGADSLAIAQVLRDRATLEPPYPPKGASRRQLGAFEASCAAGHTAGVQFAEATLPALVQKAA